jgi:uncharacterized protein YegP (UPF0339 family)
MPKQKRIEVFTDRRGNGRYRLIAANGEVIASSESYSRRADAKRAARRNHPGVRIVVL